MKQPEQFEESIKRIMEDFSASPDPGFRTKLFPDGPKRREKTGRKFVTLAWWGILLLGAGLLLAWLPWNGKKQLTEPPKQPEAMPLQVEPAAAGFDTLVPVASAAKKAPNPPPEKNESTDDKLVTQAEVRLAVRNDKPTEFVAGNPEALTVAADGPEGGLLTGFALEETRRIFDSSGHWQILERADELRRPVLLHLYHSPCNLCHRMDTTTLRDNQVRKLLEKDFEVLSIDLQKQSTSFRRMLVELFEVKTLPAMVIPDLAAGQYLKTTGFQKPEDFRRFLEKGLRMIAGQDGTKAKVKCQMLIAPNPTTGPFSVEVTGMPGPLQLRIFDRSGNRLKQEFLADFTGREVRSYDLSGKSGTIVVSAACGQQAVSQTLVIVE